MSSAFSVTFIVVTKAQHNLKYKPIPNYLRQMRENAGLTQRDIGRLLNKPQSYIYNCETANRRVDITEFISWAKACGLNPRTAFYKLLKHLD
jgi:transcriptional regulator with XRE-family HTH domain